jgi:hypothetical protein
VWPGDCFNAVAALSDHGRHAEAEVAAGRGWRRCSLAVISEKFSQKRVRIGHAGIISDVEGRAGAAPPDPGQGAVATESPAETVPELQALNAVVGFVYDAKGSFVRTNPFNVLIALTTRRSTMTAIAIANLLTTGLIDQAQMLCRPLFEDMAVIHWLCMQEDPTYLVERFFNHQDAAVLHDYDFFTKKMGLPYGDPASMTGILARRDELAKLGPPKDPHWWGARPDGTRISLRGVVAALQTHRPYAPRLHGGDEPALRDTYALANKWANEELHHSPRGLPMWLTREGLGDKPADARRAQTAATAYWIFGQTASLQLSEWVTDPELAPRFEKLFAEQWPIFIGATSFEEAREQALDDLARARAEFSGKATEQASDDA